MKVFLFLFVIGFVCRSYCVNAQEETKTLSVPAEMFFSCGTVFFNDTAASPHALLNGSFLFNSGSSIVTLNDGQAFVRLDKTVELRTKEETSVVCAASDSYEVRMGTAGFSVSSDSTRIYVKTAHLNAVLSEGIFVFKTNPVMTRLCVIKGSASIGCSNAKECKTVVEGGFEIAAGSGRLSRLYKFNDDLRFTWYWTTPDKEPSLRK